MQVKYSEHAKKRMKQRGVNSLEVRHILKHPQYIKNSYEGRKEAVGIINSRLTKVIFIIKKPNFIKVITVV